MISKTEQQILIALNAQYSNKDSLASLVNMAKLLNASLTGLFVEDSRLIEVANLPFTTEINRFSAEERNLHADTLMRATKRIALEIQNLMKALSAEHKVSWTYSIEAGELISKALSYEGFDIFFPARNITTFQPTAKIKKPPTYQQLVLLYDVSPQFDRAMDMIQTLAGSSFCYEITVLCETELPAEIKQTLSKINHINFKSLTYNSPLLLHSLNLPPSTLIVSPKNKIQDLSTEELTDLTTLMACSLLLID
ncbi:MAG: hypothetical protein V7718_03880 [Porticoccus sp.]